MATLTKVSAAALLTSNGIVLMPASVQAIDTRRPSRQDSRALDTLSHAIEYLSDRYVESTGTLGDQNSLMQAINLLMSLHADLYTESTQKAIDPVREHVWSWLLAG